MTLTLAAVPSVDGIACAASTAELITAFDGRPAELAFIGVDQQGGDGVDALELLRYRYPPRR